MNHELLEHVLAWLAVDPDEGDRETIEHLMREENVEELERRFSSPLTFGTAGLRGPVMAGPAGMNRCTVRRATQGVVAWLCEIGADISSGVVVGRDARRGSDKFNDEAVAVLLGAGVPVWEMPGPLPTPFVAYAVKHLDAAAGIMITASHNPPADNGYKLYGDNGSQIIAPSDEMVERFAAAAGAPQLGDRSSALHRFIGAELFAAYRDHFVQRFAIASGSDLPITYTPLHGVGGAPMMELFAAAGYRNVNVVDVQFEPDARFPTLPFPNPEEPGALDLAIARADATSASLVIANDPDADRLGVAVRGPEGWRVLRGDEIGWLLASTLLESMTSSRDVVATTIVSSTLLSAMAESAHVRFVTTLTGFKWISRAAGEDVLQFGYEEALGFAVDPAVADKDGMSAALALCQMAHDLDQSGETLLDCLDEIESRYGVHCVDQLSLRAEGPQGPARIAAAMQRLREAPPTVLGPLMVSGVHDLSKGYAAVAPTDGMLLTLGDSGRVVVRPSGTEPKLKAYLEVTTSPDDPYDLRNQRERARAQLEAVRADLEAVLAL